MADDGLKKRRVGCGLLAGLALVLFLAATLTAPPFRLEEMKGLDNYAMAIPSGAEPAEIAAAARERCKQASICSVFGWTDDAQLAGALPLTEREASTLAFQYSLNRNSGLDRTLFDCTRWPRASKGECLSRE